MLRIILKRKCKEKYNGLETETFETMDIEIPHLECLLKRGGIGEDCYDVSELCGVEIL